MSSKPGEPYLQDGSEDWYWYSGNFFFILGILIGSIITIIHTKNVCSDLLTEKRLSIHHRNSMPSIDWTYKLISWCLLISLCCYLYNMIFAVLSNFATFGNHSKFCYIVALNSSYSYQLSKMFMYLVFVIRLYAVYNSTAYRYNPILLIIISVFIILFSLIIMVMVSINVDTLYYGHENGDSQYIVSCGAELDLYILGMIAIFDFGLSLFSMFAFIIPLKKVIKSLNDTDLSPQIKYKLNNLMSIGQKNAILTSTAAITTLFLIGMVGIGYLFLAPLDLVTNMICMVLTTPYYNDYRYYDRICLIPIKCSNYCCNCCCGAKIEEDQLQALKLQAVASKTRSSTTTGTDNTNTETV